MTFEDISADFGSMTSGQVGWYAETRPDHVKVCRFIDFNREACLLEMVNPARAAPTIWVLVNQDRSPVGGDSATRKSQQCRC